ncbi:MAG: hypothetical protein ACI9FD_004467, partial [Gammaproteobacteria bacterium]
MTSSHDAALSDLDNHGRIVHRIVQLIFELDRYHPNTID